MSEVTQAEQGALQEIESADTGAPALLITGMPGAGKTNYVIATFALGKRDVYQANIPGCTLPAFDPEKWDELLPSIPVDSTLLFDEGREIFPPKNATADPPKHYVLNRIRHTGRRVVILTQHPSDIDARVRRLCSRHIHLVEGFGGGYSKTYEWRGRIGDVDGTRADALAGTFIHDKRAFKFYKSTEMHRGTAKTPWKVRMIKPLIGAALLLACVGGWWVYHLMSRIVPAPTGSTLPGVAAGERPALRPGVGDHTATVGEYVASFSPRVEGLAYTAARFDPLTKPKRVPVPAACVESASRGCRCYSQQATPLEVPKALCKQIVAGGTFLDFDADGEGDKRAQVQLRSTEALPAIPSDMTPAPAAGFARRVEPAAAPGPAPEAQTQVVVRRAPPKPLP